MVLAALGLCCVLTAWGNSVLGGNRGKTRSPEALPHPVNPKLMDSVARVTTRSLCMALSSGTQNEPMRRTCRVQVRNRRIPPAEPRRHLLQPHLAGNHTRRVGARSGGQCSIPVNHGVTATSKQ